jgi:transposase InsO family protein
MQDHVPMAAHAFHPDESVRALTMVFDGWVQDERCRVLVDSGATCNLVSAELVQKLKLPISSTKSGTILQLANGEEVEHLGFVTLSIMIQGYRFPAIVCTVMNMQSLDWDLLLGEQWLRGARANISYDEDCVKGYTRKGKPFTFRCQESMAMTGSDCVNLNKLVISMVQAKRLARKGCKTFLSSVTKILSDADSAVEIPAPVRAILQEYDDVFPDEVPGLPPVRPGVSHTIPLSDPLAKPPSRPLYRLSRAEVAEAERQVKLLLEKKFIEPSTSPYGAPILFVQKKDGSLRMVIDYRALNRLTVKNGYPMPRIDDALDQLQGAALFTSLDLTSGYHQIRISEEDVPKTAFRTPEGLFQWRVLPFGLTNAPATFQTAMNTIFKPFLNKFVLVYLDDILVYSKTPAEHCQHLRQVFGLLREHKLYANAKKCSFAQSAVAYLGHVVSKDGVKVDPRKTAAVINWPPPTNLAELRSFLGLATYFRKFLRDFARMAMPLHRMTRKGVPWDWTSTCQTAFDDIKQALTEAPCLAFPDFTQPFEVHTDASLAGIGAVLSQNGRPIAFESRRLTPAEVNYPTGEQELLAVVHALTVWRCYLEGGLEFRVVTDHKAITYLDTIAQLSRRQTRWAEFLSRFNFTWAHVAGSSNVVADALSRTPVGCAPPPSSLGTVVSCRLRPTGGAPCFPTPTLRGVLCAVTRARGPPSAWPASGGGEARTWKDKFVLGYQEDAWFLQPENAASLVPHSGFLLHEGKIAVPNAFGLRTHLMEEMHDSPYAGHLGVQKTLKLVARHYWWPTMAEDVKRYVTVCHLCQKNKARQGKPSGLLQPLELPHVPWHTVTMDFITQLPRTESGHDAILVVVDKLTKMVHLVATTTTATAEQTARLYVDHIWKLHGVPQKVVTDRDPLFTSHFTQALCRMLGTKQAMSTAYHPQTDGQTERVNRVLEDMLRMYVSKSQTDWDEKLACAEFAINNADHSSTGTTPFMLNYGHHPYLPVTVLPQHRVPAASSFVQRIQRLIAEARQVHRIATERQVQFANARRRDVQFAPGDWVLLSAKNLRFKEGTPKLLPRWVGPFQVSKKVGGQSYELILPARWKVHDVFHVSKLERYRRDGNVQPPPPAEMLEGEDEYEVEHILDHRHVKSHRTYEFLVRWAGYSPEHDTWEPEANLKNAPNVLKEYWARVNRRAVAPGRT